MLINDDCALSPLRGIYGALAMAWDACSKMNGMPAVVIRAEDPIEEIEKSPLL